ncbi:response regulator transcription factor [Pontiellaceae bacterium B12219]|nr:response regulator transcription factor [Pontiellaceae bacterium B12219]
MKKNIQIMLVEDNPEYRETIEFVLSKESDINLINPFGNAELALSYLQHHSSVEIVLLDLNLPGMSGQEALPWILKYSPDTKVVILSQSDREADILSAIKTGATGYLLKSATMDEIKQGIRTVLAGGATIDRHLANFILSSMKKLLPKNKEEVHGLSKRETEVLALIAEGLSHKQVGKILHISNNTVADHLKNTYSKLNVPNAPAAISKAFKTGILHPDQ